VSEIKGNLNQGVSGRRWGEALGARVEGPSSGWGGDREPGVGVRAGTYRTVSETCGALTSLRVAECETDVLYDALAAKGCWVTSVRDGQGGPSNEP